MRLEIPANSVSIRLNNAMNEIKQFAPAEWQSVSQCFSVESWVGIQIKNRSVIHSDFQNSKHKMPERVADRLYFPSNICGVAPKCSKVGG